MLKFKGDSVYAGVAIGKLHLYKKAENKIERRHTEDSEFEKQRFDEARQLAISQLKDLYEKALKDVGEANAMIFEVHQMMLDDLDYIESVQNIVEDQKVNAEYAVATTGDNFSEMFEAMDDAYMKGRAADIRDITERILTILSDEDTEKFHLEEPVIICAQDLAPSETVQFEKDKLLGFITQLGSINSHTAILARTMDIPAVIQTDIDLNEEYNGKVVIVDGFTGEVYLDPDENIMKEMKEKQEKALKEKLLLQELKGKATKTKSGKEIQLYANIGNVKDLGKVIENDAEGIGLFRSEFIYLDSDNYPTEDEQFSIYKTVAETMAGKKVIIRTLDIGADKKVDYFELEEEENPALGYRAIRICLDRPELFKTQLRALYRASAFGNIAIMIPMIISTQEVLKVKEIILEVKEELKADHIPYKDVELGIMIETPAAAIMSDELAKEVDFFSIGTNDLTQYTLAVDRQNPKLGKITDTHHPAILRLIETVIKNAHASGIWAGICGELGADTTLTETFLKMGVDELSVSPPQVLKVRKKIRDTE